MTEPIVISDYAEASQALRDRNLRQALYDEGAVIMQDVLVNLHGDQHRARRNTETTVFRRDFFRFYETEVFPATLEETIAPFAAAGGMDLVDFGYRVMVNLTADFAGIDRPTRSPEETADLMGILRLFGKTATLAHATVDREAVRDEALAELARFNQVYIEPSIAARQARLDAFAAGEITESELSRDILTALLRNENGIDLSRETLTREMAFFALAGAHTSIHTLTHAVHEILTWTAAHPGDRERLTSDPRFLQCCVMESIRLHPSSPIASRRSLCPIQIAGQSIDKDDNVVIDLQRANRSEAVFGEDAGHFNPLRVLPKGQPRYGLSFGQGMHACLGLNLAAGVLPPEGEHPGQLGTVALIIQSLLAQELRPDPDQQAAKDTSTQRDLWGFYPVLLGS